MFNLLLNSFEVNNSWAYELTKSSNNILVLLDHNSYYYYYHYGHNNYMNLNTLDVYRIFISLLFKYYNNFLEKLSRYSYILSFKHLKKKTFFFVYLKT